MRHRELDAVDLDGAALVHPERARVRRALRLEPRRRARRSRPPAGECCLAISTAFADVVAVAVRDREHVAALGLLLALRALRVVEPGVDVDALALGAVEPVAAVSEPGEGDVRQHALLGRRWSGSLSPAQPDETERVDRLALALRLDRGSGSTSASSPIASRVAAAMTTSPGRAAAWSRAAVFVVSPITAKLRCCSAPT